MVVSNQRYSNITNNLLCGIEMKCISVGQLESETSRHLSDITQLVFLWNLISHLFHVMATVTRFPLLFFHLLDANADPDRLLFPQY